MCVSSHFEKRQLRNKAVLCAAWRFLFNLLNTIAQYSFKRRMTSIFKLALTICVYILTVSFCQCVCLWLVSLTHVFWISWHFVFHTGENFVPMLFLCPLPLNVYVEVSYRHIGMDCIHFTVASLVEWINLSHVQFYILLLTIYHLK